jgi:hypothetical protein
LRFKSPDGSGQRIGQFAQGECRFETEGPNLGIRIFQKKRHVTRADVFPARDLHVLEFLGVAEAGQSPTRNAKAAQSQVFQIRDPIERLQGSIVEFGHAHIESTQRLKRFDRSKEPAVSSGRQERGA